MAKFESVEVCGISIQYLNEQAGASVSDAASAEHTARDKWLKAAKALHKVGVTVAMLTKGTKEKPNDSFSAVITDSIRTMVIQGVSASKKAVKFSTPHPSTDGADSMGKASYPWTVAQLLALNKDQLRSIDDDVLKQVRRTYMMLIDGPMMSRIRVHLDKIENPDKAREPKTTKTEAKTEATGEGFDLRTWAGVQGSLNGMLANLAHWCTPSARDQMENALRHALASMPSDK